jgi:hypothetical protein
VCHLQSIGIDLGTTYVKTSNERVFPSGISENIFLSNNIMEVDGKKYAMGLLNYKSTFDININKTLNRNVQLNFYYALYLEGIGTECYYSNVYAMLPASQWKNEHTVQKFKELLTIPDGFSVKLNGLEKKITVESIDVIPEGSTAYFTQEVDYEQFNGRKVLLLDWGALTINQILFDKDEVIDLHTDEFGVLKIYKDMAEKITSETGHNVRMEDMYDILCYGFLVNGELIDVEPIIKPIALEHCSQIHKNLKLKWSVENVPYVLLVGAGSITMEKYIKKFIPHAKLQDNAQLLAAIGMNEMVGVQL